jgi:hypothetical protein
MQDGSLPGSRGLNERYLLKIRSFSIEKVVSFKGRNLAIPFHQLHFDQRFGCSAGLTISCLWIRLDRAFLAIAND